MASFGDLLNPTKGKVLNNYTQTGNQPYIGTGTNYVQQSNVLGASTTGGGSNGQAVPAGNQTLQNNIQQQTNDLGSIIDRDYETALGQLDMQQQNLQGQAGTAQQAIQSQYGQTKTAIGQEAQTKQAGLDTEAQTAQKQQASSLQQARDLYRQVQQQNISQLSASGLSSSSVAEGLAEKLGVETARRIAGVTGSTNEIMQNIAQERTRTQTYYQQKQADLEQTMQSQIAGIQQSLMEGINQINSARGAAAADKANKRQSLITNAQSAMAQLQAQAQNFQQSLEQWQAQRTATLQQAQQFVINPTDFSGLNNYAQQVSQLGEVGGFQPVPTFDTTKAGYAPGIKYEKKAEEDPYTAALRAAGIQ